MTVQGSLVIDFLAIQIVLVRPVSVVRDHARLSAWHSLTFGWHSKIGNDWQRETE